jgi:hypothetical protein
MRRWFCAGGGESSGVVLIGTVGGCREAEEEGGIESVEEAAIRRGVGVVDFVDDDVVEALGGDASEVVGVGQFLDRADHDGPVRPHEFARAPPTCAGWPAATRRRRKKVRRLSEELLSVREKEDAPRRACAACVAGDVEGGEPGLAEAGGEHDD